MVKITDVDATGSLRDPSGVEASSVCMDGWDCALSAARQINKTMRVRALKALVGGAQPGLSVYRSSWFNILRLMHKALKCRIRV